MKQLLMVLFCIGILAVSSSSLSGQEYRDVMAGDTVKLPRDLYYRKDYRVQWWYFTGHLQDDSGRDFGYELTFFSAGIQKKAYKSEFGPNTVYISHFAISDIDRKKFFYAADTDTGAFGFAGADEDRLNVWVGNDSLEKSGDRMYIKASDGETWISLWLVPTKPAVLNGEGGYSRKSSLSPSISSLYFSYTSLETKGSLRIGDALYQVQGKSWFDREISSRELGEDYAGWDWFALQLDDNREVMLYLVRKKDGSIDDYSSGTFVYEDGRYRILARSDFVVTVKRHYTSKKTGARYPSKWEITIPSEKVSVVVSPLIEDQEFLAGYSTWNYYWEGACEVEGTATGKAYVEMTGY